MQNNLSNLPIGTFIYKLAHGLINRPENNYN